MPELPEVETTARGLRPRLVGRRILGVHDLDWPNMLPNATPALLEAALPGQHVEAVGRRGKYLVLQLASGAALVFHRKMTGNLILRATGATPARHTHLVMRFEGDDELHFIDPRKFGRIYYFEDTQALEAFFRARLGPEPLEELTPVRLGQLVVGRRRRIKSLLLDQKFLAGLGNLYADEALWVARLHPERAAQTLTTAELRSLVNAIRTVLEQAIERRGTSLSDYLDASGEPGANQSYLRVYGRAGQPCVRCRAPIERRLIAQRGTWFCPRCQLRCVKGQRRKAIPRLVPDTKR